METDDGLAPSLVPVRATTQGALCLPTGAYSRPTNLAIKRTNIEQYQNQTRKYADSKQRTERYLAFYLLFVLLNQVVRSGQSHSGRISIWIICS